MLPARIDAQVMDTYRIALTTMLLYTELYGSFASINVLYHLEHGTMLLSIKSRTILGSVISEIDQRPLLWTISKAIHYQNRMPDMYEYIIMADEH